MGGVIWRRESLHGVTVFCSQCRPRLSSRRYSWSFIEMRPSSMRTWTQTRIGHTYFSFPDFNPLGTVDGYSVHVHTHYASILHNSACLHVHVHVHVFVKSLITSTWVRHSDPLSWLLGKNTGKSPSVHNLIPSARD